MAAGIGLFEGCLGYRDRGQNFSLQVAILVLKLLCGAGGEGVRVTDPACLARIDLRVVNSIQGNLWVKEGHPHALERSIQGLMSCTTAPSIRAENLPVGVVGSAMPLFRHSHSEDVP